MGDWIEKSCLLADSEASKSKNLKGFILYVILLWKNYSFTLYLLIAAYLPSTFVRFSQIHSHGTYMDIAFHTLHIHALYLFVLSTPIVSPLPFYEKKEVWPIPSTCT